MSATGSTSTGRSTSTAAGRSKARARSTWAAAPACSRSRWRAWAPTVTAIDPAEELIAAARDHAAGQGLAIDYRVAAVETIDGTFDLITAMEVIEHTADPQQFLNSTCARAPRPERPVDPFDAERHRLVAADHDNAG